MDLVPAKVKNIISEEEATALSKNLAVEIEFWNEITDIISIPQETPLKKDDIVLIDVTPISLNPFTEGRKIDRILKGKFGEKIWKEYRGRFEKFKEQQDKAKNIAGTSPEKMFG